MKSYVIYLPDYTKSVAMANVAMASAQEHGWNLELWPGVDGSTMSFSDLESKYKITACRWDRKCLQMFQQRSGVRGCFLSHWTLWHQCRDQKQTIGIFEHDVCFTNSNNIKKDFRHLLKLEGFNLQSARPAGRWYEGARAYILQPEGADRLIRWVVTNGCLPTDVNIGLDVVDIQLHTPPVLDCQINHSDKQHKHTDSFTWNLEAMTKINDRR